MKQKITINDVAAHCGVSKSSVSRYLNNGYVSEANRIKIAKSIEALGFETNFFASRLKAKFSRLLGVIVADLQDEACAQMLHGMQDKWYENGYQGSIVLTNYDLQKEKEAIRSFAQQGVDGMILLQCHHVSELEETIMKYGVPVLYANQKSMYAPFLEFDEKKAGEILGTYLAKQDMQRISYIQSDEELGKRRKAAILDAYAALALPCDFDVITIEDTKESLYNACITLLGRQRECIVCEKDMYALTMLKCCHEYHIHVPQHVSIASFGGLSMTRLCVPEVTSLAYDYDAFGKNLAEEICAIIELRVPKWEEENLEMIVCDSVKVVG